MFTTRRAYMGNTMITAMNAATSGLRVAGEEYSFIPGADQRKMVVIAEDAAGAPTVRILSLTEARAVYADLRAKGAVKCAAKRSAYGIDYTGLSCFDVEQIMLVPGHDVNVQAALLPAARPGAVIFG